MPGQVDECLEVPLTTMSNAVYILGISNDITNPFFVCLVILVVGVLLFRSSCFDAITILNVGKKVHWLGLLFFLFFFGNISNKKRKKIGLFLRRSRTSRKELFCLSEIPQSTDILMVKGFYNSPSTRSTLRYQAVIYGISIHSILNEEE